MKLEEKLAQLRKEKGLSQMYVADEMGVSRQAISRWEVGAAMPSTDNLRKLAELYGVSIDVLLNDKVGLSQESKESVTIPMVQTTELPNEHKPIRIQWGKTCQYIAVTVLLVFLGIWVGYWIGQHRTQEVANTATPIEELEVEQWDGHDADAYTYGWPDFGDGGEEN